MGIGVHLPLDRPSPTGRRDVHRRYTLAPTEGLSPWEQDCSEKKLRQSEDSGWRKGMEVSLGKRTEPCQSPGEKPEAQGKG